jgi:hypothetical protein
MLDAELRDFSVHLVQKSEIQEITMGWICSWDRGIEGCIQNFDGETLLETYTWNTEKIEKKNIEVVISEMGCEDGGSGWI